MENYEEEKFSKEEKKDFLEFLDKLSDHYDSFCKKTGHLGAIIIMGKNNNVLLFKSDKTLAKKVFEFTEETTKNS